MRLAELCREGPVRDWIECEECDGIPADVCSSCRKQAEAALRMLLRRVREAR